MSASPELGIPSDTAAAGGTAHGERADTTEVTVGALDDIPPGEGRAYDAAGHQVAVFRLRGGSVRAVQAVCPHRGGPLADGQTDATLLVCPLHLYAWDTATGASTADLAPLRTYPVRVEGDRVVVSVPV